MRLAKDRLSMFPVERWFLSTVILTALLVRVWGINFGLPYLYNPDEPRYVNSAQILFKTHSLDPRSLPDISSSSFVYVVNAVAYIPYYWIGKISGVFHSPQDVPAPVMLGMGVGQISKPSVFLLGRLVSLSFGLVNVLLVYWIGRKIFKSRAVGLIAAAMMALSPSNVAFSRLILPDTFVIFFILLVLWGTEHLYQSAKPVDVLGAVLTGLALGCLLSSKVSGLLIVIPLLLAFWFRYGLKGLWRPELFMIFAAGIVGFALTTPYIFGDIGKVVNDILSEGRHYSIGHPGMEGNTLTWYLSFMWGTTGIICIMAALEIIRGLYLRSKELILLSIFPVVYFIFISTFIVRNDRTFMPVTPFLFLLAASLLVALWQKSRALLVEPARWLAATALVCLVTAAISLPTVKTIRSTVELSTVDSRETARVWIDDNLPVGAKIGIESYSPFIDTGKFSVVTIGIMIAHYPDWYFQQKFDYLVFSQGMYARYFGDPARYAGEISRYNDLFRRFKLLRLFTDGGYEIRVYKIE